MEKRKGERKRVRESKEESERYVCQCMCVYASVCAMCDKAYVSVCVCQCMCVCGPQMLLINWNDLKHTSSPHSSFHSARYLILLLKNAFADCSEPGRCCRRTLQIVCRESGF